MMLLRHFVILAGLLATNVGIGAAPSKLTPPDTTQYLRWGPIRVRPSFQLTNLGYDDNIFSDNQNQVADYRGTLSPRVAGLLLLGNRAFLDFREQLDLTAYKDNSDQNYIDTRGRVRLTVPLNRFGLFTDLTYNRIKQRPFDREDIRRTQTQQTLGIGTIVSLGWRTEVELGVRETYLSFADPDLGADSVNQLDRNESTLYADASYRLQGRTDLLFEFERLSFDFDRLFVSMGLPLNRDAEQQTAQLGVRLDRGGPIVGTLLLGQSEIRPDSSSVPGLSEWVGEAEIVYGMNTPTRLRLEASRRPGFAIFGNNNYYLRSNLELRAVRYLNRAIGVEAAVSTGRLSFPESLDGLDRKDRLRGWEAGMRLRLGRATLGRKLEYSLRFGRNERNSNIDERDRTQTTFVLDAVVDF